MNNKFKAYELFRIRKYYSPYKHSFHIVTRSPWPFMASMAALFLTLGMVMYCHLYRGGLLLFTLGLFLLGMVMYVWWRDVVREATYMGYHTKVVQQNIRIGFILFLVSEVMFFFSFFWAFFHSSLSPSHELGSVWPPLGIPFLDPMKIPLLNTIILLTSGATVTLSHHALRCNSMFLAKFGLILTVLLGVEFTGWQMYEYYTAHFYLYDGVYASTFYMTTGLHGVHVIIGTLFLGVGLIRMYLGHFSADRHLGYLCAIWYWHFVDVVWLFLYISIYCWGSGKLF